ncbi:MAG: hypothetical protein K2W96_00050 [Gemmataceae bacterium]|nr:hypothetical protein [Gemmataceae bacterium]
MNAVKGTVRGGMIVLDEPNGFVEGQRVEVVAEERPSIGMDEKDWPTTPEGIAALLARMDEFKGGWLSDEDYARWRAELQKQKERDIANEEAEAEKVRRMWE